MRNFGDAKAMAQTLRAVLAKRGVKLSHSESLELVAAMLGVSDWNTMSAALKASTAGPAASAAPRKMPAFPLRNLVAFPAAVIPLFVGRDPPPLQWTPMLALRSWRGVSDGTSSTPDIPGVVQAGGG